MISSIRTAFFLGMLTLLGATHSIAAPYIGKPKGDNTRVTNPTVISAELLGRGMVGSVYFDQALNEDLVAGFGFSLAPTNQINSNISSGRTAFMIPAYLNYYLSRAAGSFFATAGANLVANANYVSNTETTVGNLVFPNSDNSIIPTFGVGYESRGDNGFLFRVTGYGLVADSLTGWVGFSFGIAL